MVSIRTVLCPIGFDDLDVREIELAAEVCRAFGARLVLHRNLGSAILSAEEQVDADLVVMATHGAGTDDHASVATQTIERSRCPVLVLRSGCTTPELRLEPSSAAGLRRVVVPTDLTPSGQAAVSFACDLARALPWELHLLHVIPPGRSVWSDAGAPFAVPEGRGGRLFERATLKLDALVPEDLERRILLHVVLGHPAEEIAKLSARLDASCIVMGAHARGFLRRFFTRDTSRELLHRAPCPVWFVPQERAS